MTKKLFWELLEIRELMSNNDIDYALTLLTELIEKEVGLSE